MIFQLKYVHKPPHYIHIKIIAKIQYSILLCNIIIYSVSDFKIIIFYYGH